MGGSGSGNGGASRSVAYIEEAPRLDASSLKPYLIFGARSSLTWPSGLTVNVNYERGSREQGGSVRLWRMFGEDVWVQTVFLVPVACVGATRGQRLLLRCPSCHTLRRSLYLGQLSFFCRDCHRLRYRSQSLSPRDRAYLVQVKTARKIDPSANPSDPPRRPARMQRRTYHKHWVRWLSASLY